MSWTSRRGLALAAIALTFAACSTSTSPTPPPPPVGSLSLTCPASMTVTALVGSTSTSVTYAAPTVSGGTPPVNVTCAPASGSTFPIGSTPVNCTASDSLGRTAVCSSTVSVNGHAFGAPKIVAFGDSITAGQNGLTGNNVGVAPGCSSFPSTSASTQSAIPQFIDVPDSYPTQLQTMLDAAFVPGPIVANLGVPGETAVQGTTRLQSSLPSCAPDALLLVEGINDIDGNASSSTVVSALQADVNTARAAGVKFIFLGTLLPQRDCVNDGVIECAGRTDNLAAINTTNAGIKSMAAASGVPVVDLYNTFTTTDSTLVSLISNDGLHPTTAGFALIARTFYSAMVSDIPVASVHLAIRR